MKFKSLENLKFGRLTVLYRVSNNIHNHTIWLCRCECLNFVTVSSSNLRSENSTSCGCLRIERAIETNRLRPYEALYRLLLRSAKKFQGKEVDLSYEDFLLFTEDEECHYCGEFIEWSKFDLVENGTGYHLDRKDNAKGYTLDNCVVCCTRCNWSKSNQFTYNEWKQIGNLIKTWKK